MPRQKSGGAVIPMSANENILSKDSRICVLRPGVTLLAGTDVLSDCLEEVYAERTICFLNHVSETIRKLDRKETSQELKSLGFWLRRAHLSKLKEEYEQQNKGVKLGRGMSFHIAPSNVPLMFFYSCAIGLLAGNSCLIRLSGRCTQADLQLCSLIETVLQNPSFADMRERISLIQCDRDNTEAIAYFSESCDARIVWGGDETIRRIRLIPLKASAVEMVFPNRWSMTVLDAEAVLGLEQRELELLAVHFWNDTYSMDQNACSCPKAVYWRKGRLGNGEKASGRFWEAVSKAAEKYDLTEMKVSQKYANLWEAAGTADNLCRIKRWGNRLYVAKMDSPQILFDTEKWKFGMFAEYHMTADDEWSEAVAPKVQTLTYFGVERDELAAAVQKRKIKGVSRIVPVGQALWMETNWDGIDMIGQLSRRL